MNVKDKEFLFCDCDSHAISLSYDYDYDVLDISFWQMGFNSGKVNLVQRIKYAFQLLKNGNVHSDMVILNKKERKKLSQFLSDLPN